MRGTTSNHARCAAGRGADGAARRPYLDAATMYPCRFYRAMIPEQGLADFRAPEISVQTPARSGTRVECVLDCRAGRFGER